MKKSCLRCSRYLTCREKQKSPTFFCSNYSELSTGDGLGLFSSIELAPDQRSLSILEEGALTRTNQKFVDSLELPTKGKSKKVSSELDLDVVDEIPDDFILKAMRDAYDPHTNSVRDLKINDLDLDTAANYYDFCTRVAGKSIKTPFARQLWLSYTLLSEACPRCTPQKYQDIMNIPVDMPSSELVRKVSLFDNGVCPRCKTSKAELVLKGELVDFNQLALLAGQRAGKSSVTATLSGYILHKYLKAPRLSQICGGIQDFTPLTFTFVGVTAGRAIKLLWTPLMSIVDESSWFKDYFDILKEAGRRDGKEYFKKSTLFLSFYNKKIDLYPSSPIKRTLRGDTRILACLSGSTRILTDHGWTRLDNPLITTHRVEVNGSYKNVSRWIPQGKKTTYRAEFKNGMVLDATLDHKIRVYSPASHSLSWVPLGSLSPSDFVVAEVGRGTENINRVVPLISNTQPERGSKFKSLYDFFVDAHFSDKVFTNEDLQVATGASLGVLTTLNTRLKRKGIIYRSGGRDKKGNLYLKVRRTPTSVSELRRSPTGPHTKKWDKPTPAGTSPELARIIGYLLADGDLQHNLKVDNTSSRKMKDFSDLWEKVFGVSLYGSHSKSYRFLKADRRLYFGGRRVSKFLKDNWFGEQSLEQRSAYNKAVPNFVLTGTRNDQLECLSSYLSCDGTVTRSLFSFRTESARMAYGLQLLFTGLGYRTSLRKLSPTSFYLRLYNFDAVKFSEEYTGLDKRSYASDKQPEMTGTLGDNYQASYKMSSTLYRIPKLNPADPGSAKYTYVNFDSLPDYHPLASGLRYLTHISTLTLKGREETYDITVDSEEHAFNANGIVVKNCTDELDWFPYKIVSTASAESEAEGLAAADEEDERERANGDEVHQALEASLLTVRSEILSLYKKGVSNIPTGLNINISSPQSELAKLSRIYRECKDDPKGTMTLALRLPTWEISPLYSRDHPIIESSYRKNPQRAERDFGANPPKLSSSIFKIDQITPLFSKVNPNTHRLIPDYTDGRATAKLQEVLQRTKWNPQILAMDAGLVNNSFSVIIGERISSNKIQVNTVLELMPRAGTKIHFPSVYRDILLPLIKTCNVVAVGADHWNSVQILQLIDEDTDGDTIAMQFSTQQKHLRMLQEAIESVLFDLPALEQTPEFIQSVRNYRKDLNGLPMSHLFLQLLTVREVGGSFEKGEGFTDDTFRALAVLHRMSYDPRVKKHLSMKTSVSSTPGGTSNYRSVVTGRTVFHQLLG